MEDDETNYDDCPAKYMERLKSLLNYTGNQGVDDLLAQRQTPKEWLEKLTTLDFADPASVIGHRMALIHDNVPEFVLCTGKDAFTVSPWPGAMSSDRTSVVDRNSSHPGLLTLEFVGKSKVRPVLADGEVPKPSLPSVVLPIGQLRFKYETSSGIPYTHDTEYVLVVDAIAPGHPVWLIWDRLGGLRDERGYLDPETCDPVFKGVEKNFDAAQILPSIDHWLESYGNLNFNQLQESVKATGLLGSVKAKEATLAYVTERLGQAHSQVATDTMENNEISEARFAEIKAAVCDDPFKVHPAVYLQKLKEVTASDNSLEPFLNRASRVNTTPRLSPKEWLEQLTTVDFSDPFAITDHQLNMAFYLQGRFDLITDGNMDTFAVVPYVGAMFTEELPRPDSSSQTMSENVDPHPSLISLQVHPIFKPSVSGQPLPSLVLPVGKLHKKSNGKIRKVFLDTDYVLVIDALTPGHPVWLIYDRNPLDEIDIERITVDPDEQPLIFEGIGHNFDAAQIFSSVHDWIYSYGNVDLAQFEASINVTCITGAVQAKEILLPEAELLFRQ